MVCDWFHFELGWSWRYLWNPKREKKIAYRMDKPGFQTHGACWKCRFGRWQWSRETKPSHGSCVRKSRACGEKGVARVEDHPSKAGKSKISKTNRNGISNGEEGKSEWCPSRKPSVSRRAVALLRSLGPLYTPLLVPGLSFSPCSAYFSHIVPPFYLLCLAANIVPKM